MMPRISGDEKQEINQQQATPTMSCTNERNRNETDDFQAQTNNNRIKFEKAPRCIENEEDRKQMVVFLEKFKEAFEATNKTDQQPDQLPIKPDYVIWAPGRVNLIGEHIDYHGFSVLPIAIRQRIWMAISIIRANNDETQCSDACSPMRSINLLNTETGANRSSWSGKHSLDYASGLASSHQWQNYFLCGYQGVLAKVLLGSTSEQLLTSKDGHDALDVNKKLRRLPSVNILVHSDLPAGSGLSSSSALVCASALATMLTLKDCAQEVEDMKLQQDQFVQEFDRLQIANDCSRFEHLIGTQGGGMDQAIIMNGQENYAKLVQFEPDFRCDNVKLPSDVVLLVSHSGADCHKASTSDFNTRVLETKLGAALIAQYHNSELINSMPRTGNCDTSQHSSCLTLSMLQQYLFEGWSVEEIVQHLRDQVFIDHSSKTPKQEFTISELCEKLSLSKQKFIERFKVGPDIICNLKNESLTILPRCEHVFEEAARVRKFKSICDTTTNTVLLGQLMTQSHTSLRDKFQCSHPALDRLVDAALEAGALGSRLTGAGWGGCVVTMVETSKSDRVLERLKDLSTFTFMTKPESGCRIMTVD